MQDEHQTRTLLRTRRLVTILRAILLLLLFVGVTTATRAQATPPRPELAPAEATKLARVMCSQLPNVATILETVRVETANTGRSPAPPQEPFVIDDVYDALVRLGPYSLPCLTDSLLDTRWMPDPRSEPLLGAPVVGDIAYVILMDKGVHDLMPDLMHKKPDDIRMDEYFDWPRAGNHRQLLQSTVRAWLRQNPGCCGAPPVLRATAPSRIKFRMSAMDLASARIRFSNLRPGMSPVQVQTIAGKPDAIDPGIEQSSHLTVNLLDLGSRDHNENLAYIYFIERWADDIARRDPLRDRYIIVFFSAEGELTRTFSNVPDIPATFPRSKAVWERLMWGSSNAK